MALTTRSARGLVIRDKSYVQGCHGEAAVRLRTLAMNVLGRCGEVMMKSRCGMIYLLIMLTVLLVDITGKDGHLKYLY